MRHSRHARLHARKSSRYRIRTTTALVVGLLLGVAATPLVIGTANAVATVGSWQSTSAMSTVRSEAASVGLQGGNALTVGGLTTAGDTTNTAELYNATSGLWSAAGTMETARADTTAMLLPNGSVLVAGGRSGTAGALSVTATAELYNPKTNSWATTGSMLIGVWGATVSLLPSGAVLVVGGDTTTTGIPTAIAQIYNPATATWTAPTGAVPTIPTALAFGTATNLQSGRVLYAGGLNALGTATSASYVYDPVGQTWATTGALNVARFGATATAIAGGQVLVVGGASSSGTPLASAELYNPTTATWTPTTGSLTTARYDQTAVLLPNGQVLIAGGVDATSIANATAEVYSPSTQTFVVTGALSVARALVTAVALPNGNVLLAGGDTTTITTPTPAASAELYLAGVPASFAGSSGTATEQFYVGKSSSFTMTTGGVPTPAISTVGVLPTGVTVTDNGNGSATIAGTPAPSTTGTYYVSVIAQNSAGTVIQSLVITVAPVVISGTIFIAKNGTSYTFGDATTLPAAKKTKASVVAVVATPDHLGYYVITNKGNVYNYGDAVFYGSPVGKPIGSAVVAFALTQDGAGYYVVTAKGVVDTYGDAVSYGTPTAASLDGLINAFAVTPTGLGYWLVSNTGMVYQFGDANLYSALAVNPKQRPVVAIDSSPDGKGYWLITSRGNVGNFGDAKFFGSQAKGPLKGLVIGFIPTLDGLGYTLVTSTGMLYNFGDATGFGSPAGKKLASPITAVTATL